VKASHHELCFGCGLANVFGLGLEAERDDAGVVRGRFFVKQDHQGPGGTAHPGVLAAALIEGMALAQQEGLVPLSRVSMDIRETPPIGTFVTVEASPESATLRGESLAVLASARSG
jgi:acyl-coenzyme A thioesterase PaaI-like protein